MTGWMVLFCGVITLAILIQGGALLGIFLNVRRVSQDLEDLSRQMGERLKTLTAEVQRQTHAVGDKANQTVTMVNAEIARLQGDIAQIRRTAEDVMATVEEIRFRVAGAVNRFFYVVNTPAREVNAMSKAVRTGLNVFLAKRSETTPRYKRTA